VSHHCFPEEDLLAVLDKPVQLAQLSERLGIWDIVLWNAKGVMTCLLNMMDYLPIISGK